MSDLELVSQTFGDLGEEIRFLAGHGHDEMRSQRGLRRAQRPNTELVVRESVHDADAHRALQHLEHLDGVPNHLLDGQSGAGGRDLLAIHDFGESMLRVQLHGCEVYQLTPPRSANQVFPDPAQARPINSPSPHREDSTLATPR